jgi:hypothetical protein
MERARLPQIMYDAFDIMRPYIDVVALPILSFTVAEQNELNPINMDMLTYIRESRVQFVTGRRPMAQWDTYVASVRRMGADRYVALYQTAFNRFMGR